MPGKRLPAQVRFDAFVEHNGDHWFWKGYKLPNGFSRFSYKSKAVYAHHYSWFAAHGRWPRADERVVHTCGESQCVNPAHLNLVRSRRESK